MAQVKVIDDLLRTQGPFAAGRSDMPIMVLLAMIVMGGAFYGACLGAREAVLLQSLYSASKVPILLLATALICLPSFYVVNVLLGLRDDIPAAIRAVMASLAAIAVCLVSLAPLCLLAYVSGCSYPTAVFMNGGWFVLATIGGHVILTRHYRQLEARQPGHRRARQAWVILFVFVAIQMAWWLRPFVGWGGESTTFLRSHSHARNAYAVIGEALWDWLARR